MGVCWELQDDRVTAPSHGVGTGKALSCFVFKRDLFGFRELWHPVGERMQGAGAGLGFCNLSLSQSVLLGAELTW